MRTFERKGKPSGGRNFENRSFGGNSGSRALHKATCAQCGTSCEVPFRPTGERPVLCKDCFKRDGSSAPRTSRFEDRRFGSDSPAPAFKGNDPSQKQLAMINSKLDKILEILGELEEDEDEE